MDIQESTDDTRPAIYLAGPDVFFPNAAEAFSLLMETCERHGFRGVQPSDGGLSTGLSGPPSEIALRTKQENLRLLSSSAGVIANLSPFRGIEPDSGTVFDAAYATALNIPVVGYTSMPGTSADLVKQALGYTERDGVAYDNRTGCMIEDFGLRLNLKLACSFEVTDSPDQALAAMAKLLNANLLNRQDSHFDMV